MANKYEKVDNKLKVTRPERTIKGETNEYSLNFLKSQEQAILTQIDRHTARFQEDLAEVREMIAKAEELGIVIEEVIEEEELREE